MENTTNEIREIAGKKYEVIKSPCTCSCHRTGAIHMMACCNNGWVEHLKEIK